MSNNTVKKLTPVVIFDRSNPNASDVPVFSHALKQKVNTPQDSVVSDGLSLKTQAILANILSSSRADSSGGQTGGFAQEEEKYKRNEEIFEDPSLLRVPESVMIPELVHEPVSVAVTPEVVRENTAKIPALQPAVEVIAPVSPVPEIKESQWMESVRASLRTAVQNFVREFYKCAFVVELSADILYETVQRTRRNIRIPKTSISFKPVSFFKQVGHTLLSAVRLVWGKIPRFDFYGFASKAMIAGSLVLMLLTVGPMVALQVQSWKERVSYSVSNMSSNAKDIEPTPMPATPTPSPTPNPDPDKQFQISIPKIGVNSKIIANVDAANEKEYDEALKKGVAHAAGTGLPGEENKENKTIFIFGHSTNGTWNISRYNALFYGLKDMTAGDTFSMWFWGKEFHYTVTQTKVVEATDISFLTPQTTTDQLILQTCWPPGTSWKRFLVIAKPS